MAREDTDLPFGDAFSPAQLDTGDDEELVVILEFIAEYEGRPDEFDEAIQRQFFPSPDRAKNVRLGVEPAGYQIVDKDFHFTELGEELYELRTDPEALYDRFAQHVLRNLHGLKGIQIVEDLEAQGEDTINANVKQEFRDQYDFHIDETSNHWSQMRAWIAKAGIVNTGSHHYKIDWTRIEELLGLNEEELLDLDDLNTQQQAFLRALALVDPDDRVKNSVVKQIAEEAYGVDIEQSNISRLTLNPLEEAGYIEWEHVSGKANWVEPTEKFEADILKPILDDLAERTGIPRSVLRLSFAELLDDMDAESTHEKGVALETLAIKIGRLLGLTFVGWRVRGRKTGGSEVDVVMDSITEIYNRVQIQCKNTQSQLDTKQVAREVGISRMLQTNTVLMIARGGLSGDARQFANRVMRHENISIVFLTGEDLEQIDQDPTHLLYVLKGQARRISNLKSLGHGEYVEVEEEEEIVDREEQVLNEFEDDLAKVEDSDKDASIFEFTDEDS